MLVLTRTRPGPLRPRGHIASDTSCCCAFPSTEDRQLSCRRLFEMTRELRCADLIPGCDFVAHGTHDSDVMKKAAEHAKRAHRMIAIGMEVEKKARAAIRDVVGELAAGR